VVFIHGLAELVNPQNGHKEPQVVISVMIPRRTFETLNFSALDPVDCMRNFIHQMAFSKQRGFSPVKALNPKEHETTVPADRVEVEGFSDRSPKQSTGGESVSF